MFCGNCGKEVNPNSSFCSNCGNKLNTNITVNNNVSNMNYNISNNYNNPKKKSNVSIIIAMSVVAIVLVFVSVFLAFNKDKNSFNLEDDILDTRTIMIYLCGSDLESQIALATSDLEAISPSEIDLETTNIVVYTGGAKKWYNFVSNKENAIYVLEEDGFVKKESYNKESMGSSNSLNTLLDYTYENYRADKYDLIMWNHGLGALGISSDEQFMSDYLSLNELDEALKNSEFKGDNKLETVVFRSCLNSTLEMASIFVPYANYFVASEEVTWGGTGSDVLSFLNDVTLEDSGIDLGKKFISSYESSLNTLAKKSNTTLDKAFPVSTYAIIDLSKVDELEKKLGLFFKSLNLDLNYNNIARVRSNLYQYASESGCNDYDTVDLYQLVKGLKSMSSSKGEEVLNILESTIVYNWSNNDFSNGLAIYFPYRSSSNARNMHYKGYKNLYGLSDYYSFIQRFDSLQSSSNDGGFSVISKDNIKISIEDKKLSLELYDEDVDNFAKASYIIFQKNGDNYKPIFTSDTFELAKNSYTMDLNMSLIRVINKDNDTSSLVSLYTNRFNNYYTDIELRNDEGIYTAKAYFNVDDDISISKVVMSSTTASTGMYLDLKDYSNMSFITKSYPVLENDKVNDKWEENSYMTFGYVVENNYEFEKVNLDSNYYVMFKIYDVDNLYTYSDLIQVK